MSSYFFQYPLRVSQLMQPQPAGGPLASAGRQGHEHPTCALGTSIAQFLHLLLHTRPGQLRSAPDFGCAVWDLEFDNDVNRTQWEETLTRSLLAAVRQYEPRLRDVRVRLALSSVEQPGSRSERPLARQHAHVGITGVVRLTHEAFSYTTQLQLGQLAT